MIRYTLKCDHDHSFESWFRSSDDFEGQLARSLVACPFCASTEVNKSLMAPRVATAKQKVEAPTASQEAPTPEQVETAIATMRKHVEDTSDYVGLEFANEARKMHDGETESRAIYGEAKLEDAKKLLEDGVPVTPLPFAPKHKMN